MPSRLKSLELQGYKTFVSHTQFVFADTITAIVGPNGSGKSNIADSIRWVLGEQSFSLLRGKKTEDMIFSGSELRPRASMAYATLIFDNSDGWLPIDFAEVAVTRRAYRDGENEYLLNGQRVRLKDISELLARSGLAERTYTIIGQGLVDAALALRAEDRRRLFEEAAGIGLYRARREEALRRLETTRHNLERVQDILAELLPRLRSLERQAKRAQEYDHVRDDLRLLLRDWYGFHWHQSQKELTDAHEMVRQIEIDLSREQDNYATIDQKLASYREHLSILRGRLNGWHRQSSHLHIQRESISRELAVLDERRRSLSEQQQRLELNIARMEEENRLLNGRLTESNMELDSLNQELGEARSQVEKARQDLQSRQEARVDAENSLQATRQSLVDLTNQQSTLQAHINERQAQAQQQLEALQAAVLTVKSTQAELESSEIKLAKARQVHAHAVNIRQAKEAELKVQRQKISEGESARRKTIETQSNLQAELTRLKAQIEILDQAENTFVGYANGARLLLQAARENRMKGVRGVLSRFLDVSERYETAISAALGEYIDAIVLENAFNVEEALQHLSNDAARAALLPLDAISNVFEFTNTLPSDCLVATELVHCSSELQPVINLLLRNSWIVTDRNIARKLVIDLQTGDGSASFIRIITLQGEIFHVNGPIIAGQDAKAGVLGRQRQRRELKETYGAVETRLSKVVETLHQVDQVISQLHALEQQLMEEVNRAIEDEKATQSQYAQVEITAAKIQRQLSFEQEQSKRLEDLKSRSTSDIAQFDEELKNIEDAILQTRDNLHKRIEILSNLPIEELQAEYTYWTTRTAVVEQAIGDAQKRLDDRKATLEQAVVEGTTAEERLREILSSHQSIDMAKNQYREDEEKVNHEINQLQIEIDPAEKDLENVESSQEQAQVIETHARQALAQVEHRHTQSRINLARRQESLESLRQRIEDDFGLVAFDYADDVSGPTPLPLDGMVEQLPRLTVLPFDLEENIRRLRAQLRRMGPINPEAQKEHEEVQQRYEFLTVQVTDLQEAEAGIKEVIAELDLLMEREFRKTFDAVAHEFREIFARLFGGGTARLVLTDPLDLTTTGIDIEARLPGRREQGLSLLSGGERSLTASALVFSLLKVSPTPFCVFDEVDAMLDEANVGRFRELLGELSQSTQFVIITHNRNTVQVADVLYGITMGRDSASQVVSLKLDEVSQVVE